MDIVIVEYTKEDEQEFQLFEEASNQALSSSFPLCYIESGLEYFEDLTARHRQFENYRIFLAKDSSKIVGVLHGVIKQVYYRSELVNIGQLFGMRVLPAYQQKGIATRLALTIEKELQSLGATHIFCKVEASNINAHSLLVSKLNYEETFFQKIRIIEMEKSRALTLLTPEQGLEKTQKYYGKTNLMIKNVEEMFEKQNYLGTFVLENENNDLAGVSLWNCSNYSDVFIKRVIVKSKNIEKFWVFYALILVLGSLGFWYLAYLIFTVISTSLFRALYTISIILVGWKLERDALTIAEYGWTCLKQGKKIRARTFGQFYFGDPKNRQDLFMELIYGLRQVALDKKIDIIFYEYHQKDPVNNEFLIYNLSRLYFQKALTGNPMLDFNQDSFIDPRD